MAQVPQPMQLISLITTMPPSVVREMAPVGQPIMQTGSTQCMQALATMRLPSFGPWRMNFGFPPWVSAQARTQSSQRVHFSRSMTIVLVPLMKRRSTAHSRKASSAIGRAAASIR
ncbi:MAG: hypothetical protein NT176_05245, partial [Proteobacteria bacterium]|nr:hypothetical protein [Pseudomonadota bacterium]